MSYQFYCYACKRQTEHVWTQVYATDKYRTHGRITDTVGWLECPECRKQQTYGKAEGRQG